MGNTLLYIGLNGLAGSGKDTVAKMLRTILGRDWNSIDECKEYYKETYKHPSISATFDPTNRTVYESNYVYCIAFADQLKNICSTIFGIPVERFYQNKSTAWVCMNKDFQYTEIQPDSAYIVTADDYYNNINTYKTSSHNYWMSLREILVYIGTYVLQQDVNKNIFVNVVNNNIKNAVYNNPDLKYVIVTDIRFVHEIMYVRDHKGITISIVRDDVKQLDNVAEHEFDCEEDVWDYVIENNSTYDDLFNKLWDILHNNPEFKNETVELQTREEVHNYLRLIDRTPQCDKYRLCSPYAVQKIARSEGEITLVDPIGGPTIQVDVPIAGTELIPTRIMFNNDFTIECWH